MSNIKECDKCGAQGVPQSTSSKPKDWIQLELRVGKGPVIWFDLCSICAERVGLEEGDRTPNLGAHILDIFYDIAEDVVNNG